MTCPVCGFDRLPGLPENYLICPSCGTEFGYDDFAETEEELQERRMALTHRWLGNGARWFSRVILPPHDWNPYEQVVKVSFRLGGRKGIAGYPLLLRFTSEPK